MILPSNCLSNSIGCVSPHGSITGATENLKQDYNILFSISNYKKSRLEICVYDTKKFIGNLLPGSYRILNPVFVSVLSDSNFKYTSGPVVISSLG